MSGRNLSRRPRNGFALMLVLWLLTIAAGVVLAMLIDARSSIDATANRVSALRARWLAEGCAQATQGAIDAQLAAGDGDAVWSTLDSITTPLPATGCTVTLVPSGITLDVNSAGVERTHALFAAAGIESSRADSLAEALADWIDADNDVRLGGAERDWYRAQGRGAPRNGPLADVRELEKVRGMANDTTLRALLDVRPSRVLLNRAPVPLLATVPGMTPAIIGAVMRMRIGSSPITLAGIAAAVDPATRDLFVARIPELAGLVAEVPDGWTVVTTATEGVPAITVEVTSRIVRSGRRIAIVERRRVER